MTKINKQPFHNTRGRYELKGNGEDVQGVRTSDSDSGRNAVSRISGKRAGARDEMVHSRPRRVCERRRKHGKSILQMPDSLGRIIIFFSVVFSFSYFIANLYSYGLLPRMRSEDVGK